MNLSEFDTELVSRGFDGIDQVDRYRYINWGIRHIAMKFPWLWSYQTKGVSISPGQFAINVSRDGTDPGSPSITRFRSVKTLIITSPNQYRGKLEPATEEDFLENWLPLDLTAAANRGIPEKYFFWNEKLHLLPPPNVAMTVDVHYHIILAKLVSGTESPILPDSLEEGVVLASLMKIHTRANEPALASLARQDLEEFLDQIAIDDDYQMEEEQERVEGDDTWL